MIKRISKYIKTTLLLIVVIIGGSLVINNNNEQHVHTYTSHSVRAGEGAPLSMAVSINAQSTSEVNLSYTYVENVGADIWKPEKFDLTINETIKTISTPEETGIVNIASVDYYGDEFFDFDTTYTAKISNVSFGGTADDAVLADIDSYLVTGSTFEFATPNIDIVNVYKNIWLIIILITIAGLGGAFYAYFKLVYRKYETWIPPFMWKNSTSVERNIINIQTISNDIGIKNPSDNELQVIKRIVKLANSIEDERVRSEMERERINRDNSKSENLHEKRGRSEIYKNVISSLDMINMTIEAGRNNKGMYNENEQEILEGWFGKFEGIVKKICSEVELEIIEPTRDERFNQYEHKVIEQKHDEEIELGRVIFTKKIGYRSKDGVLRSAEVITSKGPINPPNIEE